MKKVLFSVLAFTIILASCKKYDNEFKDLRAQIAALSTQVAGVNTLVAGIQSTSITLAQLNAATAAIPGLTTSLAALTTSVAAIQTSLASVAANVNNITANLATLSATVAANNTAALAAIAKVTADINIALNAQTLNINAATKAEIAAQTAILQGLISGNSTAIAANSAAIAASQAALSALIAGNATQLTSLNAQLTASTTNLLAAIADNKAAILLTSSASAQAVMQAAINALTTQLAIANANIQTLLNSNDFFNGDLTINSEASLAFAESLGSKVKIINGFLNINTTGFTAGQMTRLKQVTNGTQLAPLTAFVGQVTGTLTLAGTSGNPVDLSKLTAVSGAFTASGAAHNLSALLTAGSTYMVSGVDIMDDALLTVAGTMTLDYHGAYSYPALFSVPKVVATNKTSTSPTTGTSSINFPAISLTSTSNTIFTSGGADDMPTWVSAKSVNIKRSKTLTDLVADSATTITFGETAHTGSYLWINGLQAATVDLSALATSAGSYVYVRTRPAVTTPAQTAGVVNVSAFTGGAGTVPNAVQFWAVGPTSLDMPVFTGANVGSTIHSSSVTTATLAKHRGVATFANLNALTNVTIGDLKVALDDSRFAAGNLLTSVTVTASDLINASVSFSTTALRNTANVSVSTAGSLKSLSLMNVARLASVTTAGSMDNFTVSACGNSATWSAAAATVLNIGHSAITGASGSGTTVTVTGNSRVRSLTTSTVDRMKGLTVTGNDSLAAVNFASYTSNITGGAVAMAVHSNGVAGAGLNGTYTASIFATNTAPVMVQAGLSTLKAYAAALLASTAHTGSTINFGYNINTTGTTWVTLSNRMDLDFDTFVIAHGGVNAADFSFVQRNLDAGNSPNDKTSRINVARELTYLQ